jgi:hypothetical protein
MKMEPFAVKRMYIHNHRIFKPIVNLHPNEIRKLTPDAGGRILEVRDRGTHGVTVHEVELALHRPSV